MGAALAAALLVPTPTRTAPEWTVHFVDTKGAPMSNVRVIESWQFFAVDPLMRSRSATSDASGSVHFPAETGWANLAQRMYGWAWAEADWFGHRHYGPVAFVVFAVPGYGEAMIRGPGGWKAENPGPLETTFVLAPCPTDPSAPGVVGCATPPDR